MTTPRTYVLVQAGGRGSRLRHHTWNKPKCLVSVEGKPILYHLFDRFPDAAFVVIGDYMYDQLERYLKVNPPGVDYELIRAAEEGTLGGVGEALARVPADAPAVLVWSDLILGDLPPWPDTTLPVVCTTSAFTCRWTQAPEGHLHEKPGETSGIPGLFYFPTTASLPLPPPPGGEFVRWFSRAVVDFATLDCPNLQELGDFATIETSNDRAGFSRYFNKVEMGETRVTKTVVDHAFDDVHNREVAWYGAAKGLGFRRIPKVYGEAPLVIERIKGQHAYQMADLTPRERRAVLADHLDALISLHDLGRTDANPDDVREVYLDKTVSRVRSVSPMLPGFDRKAMTVNGRKCRNPFYGEPEAPLADLIDGLQPTRFVPIHGDATFSNALVDDKLRTWFIDPRGYFAKPGVMGDEWYDFAKVYYSAVGGYDTFNRRKFKLHVDHETVEVLMEDSAFIPAAQSIFPEYFGDQMGRIEVIHGLIWLSLSGYTRDDIDSAIAAFYLGLYWLETGLNKL
ncbi:phosphotransferase [Phenylobacterium aquaticum]|uniref:phosphotransferase n=1 Tax=Phenylobacterium aquaticum TaxID=1763816 RepID=UPI001F5C236F|nr:NTP transferase domain-containing protein [Phenylobacterium aquaticum]